MLPLLLGGIGALGSIVGGLIGKSSADKDRDAALAAAKMAMEEIQQAGLPPDQSAPIFLKYFQKAGVLTPQLEKAISLGVPQVSQIQEDPSTRNAQMGALQLMQQRANAGLTAEDRYAFNKLRAQTAADTNSKLQQILQNAQARGVGGGGATLAAQMHAAQSGANQMSMGGDAIAAAASQRALQATSQSGQLASQLRGQDFDVARTKASAADEFKRFDTQNQLAQQQRNVASNNDAQRYNLNMQQSIDNANTELQNQETYRQAAAKRQNWIDNLTYRTTLGNAATGQQNALNQAADRTANMWSGIGSGLNQAAGAAANYFAGQDQRTYDQTQRDADRQTFLDAAKMKSQGYNGPTNGSGYNPYQYNTGNEFAE